MVTRAPNEKATQASEGAPAGSVLLWVTGFAIQGGATLSEAEKAETYPKKGAEGVTRAKRTTTSLPLHVPHDVERCRCYALSRIRGSAVLDRCKSFGVPTPLRRSASLHIWVYLDSCRATPADCSPLNSTAHAPMRAEGELAMESKHLAELCSIMMLHIGMSACATPPGDGADTNTAGKTSSDDDDADASTAASEDDGAESSAEEEQVDTTDAGSSTSTSSNTDGGGQCQHECVADCSGGVVMAGTCAAGQTCCAVDDTPGTSSTTGTTQDPTLGDETAGDPSSDSVGDTGLDYPDGIYTSEEEDMGVDCELSGELPSSYNNPMLPDPFLKLDGTRITSKSEWRCQRKELQTLVENFVHSVKPPPPESVSGTVSDTSITVNVTDNGNSVSFSVSVSLPPNAQKPVAAIIGAGGSTLDGGILSSEGVATINYNHQMIQSESNRGSGVFPQLYGNNHSSVVAWAWGVSRIIDVLEQNPGTIDPTRIGVTGCSRNGKAAFGIGAFDQRIALGIPMEPGTGGIGSYRMANSNIPGDNNGEQPQSLGSAWSEAQGWFGPNFGTYTNNADAIPADAHFLGAMYAPRGLLVLDNPYIGHLCPKCGHVGAQATAKIYKALGYEENIYYFSASGNGSHCQFQSESADMLRSAIRAFLTRTEEPNGEFLVGDWATNATGPLSEWADWTAPTLQ